MFSAGMQAAGAALAVAAFGPFAGGVFGSVFSNLVEEAVSQNHLYKAQAGRISKRILATGIEGYENVEKWARNEKQTPADSKKDFLMGSSNPTRQYNEKGQLKRSRDAEEVAANPELAARKLIYSRNEFNDMGFERSQVSKISSLGDGDVISEAVSRAFTQRESTDLVGQSQQDYQSWYKASQPYPTRPELYQQSS